MAEKKLGNLLSGTAPGLPDLVRRAQEMQALTECVRAAIPPDTRPHLVSAAISETGQETTLTLIADSSSWASRIRFASEDALAAAECRGMHAVRCRVLVSPEHATPERSGHDQANTGPE